MATVLVTHNSNLPFLLTIIRQLMFYWCRWVVQLRALVTVMSTPGPVSVGAAACRHGGVVRNMRRTMEHCVNVVCIFEKKSRKMTTQIFFIFESRSENESCLLMYIKT